MLRPQLRFAGLFVLGAVVIVGVVTASLPKRYAATARVMLPPQAAQPEGFASLAAARDISLTANRGSRMLLLQHVSSDPQVAATVVNDFLSTHTRKPMVVVDSARVPLEPVGPSLARNLAYAAGGGLLLAIGFSALRERRRRVAAPAPLERMEPFMTPQAQPRGEGGLCRELLDGWLAEHKLLAIAGTVDRESRASAAARLAVDFAALGNKTLLVDAAGDASGGVRIKPVDGFENLFVLLAPGERMAACIETAARRFDVVLIDAGDRDSITALAGGAIVVTQAEHADSALLDLEQRLAGIPARVLGKILATS